MRRIAFLAVLPVALGLAAALPVPPAAAAVVPVELGMTTLVDLAVDQAHGHVYLTGGGSAGLVVRDLAGAPVTVVDNKPGASGLALSADASTLYVALANGDSIAAVDTTTLQETARYATGVGTCPTSLAVLGSRVWFGYGCTSSGNVGVLDPTTSTVLLGRVTTINTFYYAPHIQIAGGDTPRLLAASYGSSPSRLRTYGIDGTALTVGTDREVGSNLRDFAPTPDGSTVVTASGAPYYHPAYAVADLASANVYGLDNPYPNAVAIAPSGAVAAGVSYPYTEEDVRIYTPGASFIRSYDFAANCCGANSSSSGPTLATGGLAFAPDGSRLYAVARNPTSGTLWLHVFDEPVRGATALALSGSGTGSIGVAQAFTGTLTWPSAVPLGTPLRVTRTVAGETATLADVVTGANGTFSFEDAPPVGGTLTYRVTWPGDAYRQPASAQVSVVVPAGAATMTLSAPATSAVAGVPFTLTGAITASPPVGAGAVVQVTRGDGIMLPAVATLSDGTFTVTDTVDTGGTYTYVTSYQGASAEATVQVARAVPVLSIATDRSAYRYGWTAGVTLTLGPNGAGRPARIYATPYGKPAVLIRSGMTDANGKLYATRYMTTRTTFTAWFGGDAAYQPRSVTKTVTTAAGLTQRLTGQYATSNGYALYRTSVRPALGYAVAPNRAGACTTFEAQVFYSGAWHTLARNTCLRLDATSRATGRLATAGRVGYAYRVRAMFNGDTRNARTVGAWTYLRFTA